MKLEIGMYVRLINNDGILGKIITITNSNNNFVGPGYTGTDMKNWDNWARDNQTFEQILFKASVLGKSSPLSNFPRWFSESEHLSAKSCLVS